MNNKTRASKITHHLLNRSRRKLNIAKVLFAQIDFLGKLFSQDTNELPSRFLVSKANRKRILNLVQSEEKTWSDLDEAIEGECWLEAARIVSSAETFLSDSHLYLSLKDLISELSISSNPLVSYKQELNNSYEAGTLAKKWDLIHRRNLTSYKSKQKNTYNPTGKKSRILFVSEGHTGFIFLLPFIERLKLSEEVEVRTFDTSTFSNQILSGKKNSLPTYAKELIDWADVIFLEWANQGSEIMINQMIPNTKRIVLRLHSYELLNKWPLNINWGKVDELICVADHNLNRLKEVVDLEAYGCETFVLPNLFDFQAFQKPKLGDVSKVLGLCGYGQSVKRPDLALDLLELLQSDDPMWTLQFLGHFPKNTIDKDFYENFWKRAQPHIRRGTLKITPWISDPSVWFQRVGTILSCSNREGTHESCREGIASGSMGLIRNWPWAKNYGGNDDMFPDSFSWDTISEAASYLKSFESSEQLLNQGSLEQKSLLERENREEQIQEFLRIVLP